MEIKNNTVLITGGATGIGLALAEAFLKAGNRVIICGRRENKLREAQARLPGIVTRVCDVAEGKEREKLSQWTAENYPDLNVLVNNAGIQRQIDLQKGWDGLSACCGEIVTNFSAPVHLSAYFIPRLMRQKTAAIVNVSSGLGFVPMASTPVYCATKAALHSFSVSLRHQLRDTSVKVFELIPPMVDTDLDKADRSTEDDRGYRGIAPAEVAQAALKGLAEDQYEIAVGQAQKLVDGARTNFEQIFKHLNH
jgi:uncharacterized oxidoreductase